MQPLLLLLGLTTTTLASYGANLDYRSPSSIHPFLGISIRKVAKRHVKARSTWDPSKLNFTHGVASGDPYDTSVILWTRITPSTDNDASNVTVSGTVPLFGHDNDGFVAMSSSPVCVLYKVSNSSDMKWAVDARVVYTSSDVDYTVKVEAQHLKPYTQYCVFYTVGGVGEC
jgi:alkaline phosphatase D